MNYHAPFSPRLFSLFFFASIAFALAEPIPDDCKVGDFFVGCQAYTFNHFTVFEAIEKTAQAGGKVIEFYPGQKISRDLPDAKLDHTASDETLQKIKDQLAKFHVRAVSYGVVTPKSGDETEWRQVFEFAKKLGLYSITTESVQDLNIIEKLVKEYDIRVGIHEHQHLLKNPTYKVWDPKYILSVVKNRDRRIGACADTGHWASSGLQPLDCIKLLRGRIISVHLKDRPEIGKQLPDCVLGTGASDIKGILAELRRQKFDGFLALEYENNWDNSVPDVAQCVGFVRGWSARNH
jgi:sugar phosphate isomerase/epimerase